LSKKVFVKDLLKIRFCPLPAATGGFGFQQLLPLAGAKIY